MNHLTAAAAEALSLTDTERIRFTMRDQWIGYTAATEALAELNRVANHPKVQRMPNRLLVSETNNGASVNETWPHCAGEYWPHLGMI